VAETFCDAFGEGPVGGTTDQFHGGKNREIC
jgi:hypothetical protein